ncbi:ubiquitin-protein ligase [Basidiobolus meristosporus CBS 931.73]|uniref:E3 ubiquitin ligase complex SCF subunit n=1 Tax=Basidiobolus meristosporus CBS 931.73 TaxID=1314790 RepID=A0A1Y1XHE5_9FUNG|nr:ubiquitin-protein ligase [Basidiobolus meristosporus CBS 931.73]|eukprot:ORX85157.1 ubiquitin-protein ligase [Basidiobolus meristosporus CBS 931.73]
MVILKSCDSQVFQVDKEVVKHSLLISNMLEDVGETELPIPLPNVTGEVLKKVLEFCEHHRNDLGEEIDEVVCTEMDDWDREFALVDSKLLFAIVMAANYLDIKLLLEVGCKIIANIIRGKTPEQIREIFRLEDDLTEEEKEQIKKENAWAMS